jgi:hypothetical protein
MNIRPPLAIVAQVGCLHARVAVYVGRLEQCHVDTSNHHKHLVEDEVHYVCGAVGAGASVGDVYVADDVGDGHCMQRQTSSQSDA